MSGAVTRARYGGYAWKGGNCLVVPACTLREGGAHGTLNYLNLYACNGGFAAETVGSDVWRQTGRNGPRRQRVESVAFSLRVFCLYSICAG